MDLSVIDVIDMLTRLNIRNITPIGREVKFSCPFPGHSHGDSSPSATMNNETTAFFCFGCHMRGNAITFVACHEEVSPLEAARWLRSAYGSFQDPMGRLLEEVDRTLFRIEETEVRRGISEAFMAIFDVNWRLAESAAMEDRSVPDPLMYMLADRSFLAGTLEEWRVGYDRQSGRITLPVRDESGVLLGFKARSWNGEQPKYTVLGDTGAPRYGFSPYERNGVLFGLDKARQYGELILVEGELNVLAMWQHGFGNAVAMGGSFLSDRQQRLLRKYSAQVTLFLDCDQSGWDATWAAVEALERYVRVLVTPVHNMDAAEMNSDEVHKLLSDSKPALEVHITERLML